MLAYPGKDGRRSGSLVDHDQQARRSLGIPPHSLVITTVHGDCDSTVGSQRPDPQVDHLPLRFQPKIGAGNSGTRRDPKLLRLVIEFDIDLSAVPEIYPCVHTSAHGHSVPSFGSACNPR
jgi:hypothetical protein